MREQCFPEGMANGRKQGETFVLLSVEEQSVLFLPLSRDFVASVRCRQLVQYNERLISLQIWSCDDVGRIHPKVCSAFAPQRSPDRGTDRIDVVAISTRTVYQISNQTRRWSRS